MPKVTLSPEQTQQLNEWLYGGPTDPVGLINWLAMNPDADPDVIYQAEGERDLYLILLQFSASGANLRSTDITQKMRDAFTWVENSLVAWEALGLPVADNQMRMRPVWNFLTRL